MYNLLKKRDIESEVSASSPSSEPDEVRMPGDPLIWRAHILAINLAHRLPGQVALRELIVLHTREASLTILVFHLKR